MKTVVAFHSELEAAVADSSQEPRDCTSMQIGEHSRQGDCYGHRIAKRPACWNVETTDQSRQVAIGQGEGSNHRASGQVRVFWPESIEKAMAECPISLFPNEPEARRVCIGPIVESDVPWTLTHPKHAHHHYPAGVTFFTYQLDRRTMRRVVD